MRKRLPLVIALTCLIVFVMLQALLPAWAVSVLRDSYARTGPATKDMDITVGSFPAVEMLLGRVDRLNIALYGVGSEVSIESARIDLMGISFNAWEAYTNRGFSIDSVKSGTGRIVVNEAALNEYLKGTPDIGRYLRVDLSDGLVTVDGMFEVAGFEVGVSLKGTFTPSGMGVVFTPKGLSVMDSEVPGFILDGIGRQVDLRVPLSELPFPLEVASVDVQGDRLVLDVVVPSRNQGHGGLDGVKAY